jgi:predicted dehydrogenase
MATLAAERSLATAVGLQARSDPGVMYARDLVQQGQLGEILAVNVSSISQAITERGPGRIWQGDRRNGANTLTIAAGHLIDAACFIVGELDEVSARLATTVPQWRNTETGELMAVDSPDWIGLTGRTRGGAQVAGVVATVPANPSGTRLEIYGSSGTLVLSGSMNLGPNRLQLARGREPLADVEPPADYTLVPAGVPAGPPRNVAQAYVRFARARSTGEPYHPDFAHAVVRHKLIAAIERSSAEGRSVSIQEPALAT